MCVGYTVAEQIELGFMFHNFHGWFEVFFLLVFDSPITFLTVTFFFLSGKLRSGREQVFPLSLLSLAWEYVCTIYGPTHICLLLREYLHVCAQSVGV